MDVVGVVLLLLLLMALGLGPEGRGGGARFGGPPTDLLSENPEEGGVVSLGPRGIVGLRGGALLMTVPAFLANEWSSGPAPFVNGLTGEAFRTATVAPTPLKLLLPGPPGRGFGGEKVALG